MAVEQSGIARAPDGDADRLAPRAVVVALTIQLVWAINTVFSKIVVDQFPPVLSQSIRFTVLAIILLPFMQWHAGRWWPLLMVALGAGAGHFGFMFWGLKLADDVAPVLIVIQLSAPFAVLFSVLLLGERIGRKSLSGLALAFAGILVLGFDPRVLGYIDAVFFVGLAALTWGFAAVFMRQLKDIPVFDMQGWTAWGAFPILWVVAFAVEDPLTAIPAASWQVWAIIGFTVFAATLIGHSGLYWLIQRYPMSVLAPWIMMAPVFGAILGVLILGDTLTWRMVLGGLLTLAGVLIVNVRAAVKEAT